MPPDVVFFNPGGLNAQGYNGVYQNTDVAKEPPLWCRLLAAYCRDNGFNPRIIDADAENLTPHGAAWAAPGKAKLYVIVVFGHQPSASTQMMPAALQLAAEIKQREPQGRILMVGGHVAALPELTLQQAPSVDYVCTGEGPETVLALLRGETISVPGLCWRDDGEIHRSAPAPLVDINAMSGDAWDLLPPKSYYRAHNWQCFGGMPRSPYASIHTSLGCPYKCVFCCINAPFNSNRYRMRDPEAVVAEIDKLYTDYGVTTFKIVDEMFVLNERHYTAICGALAAKPYAKHLNIWAYARVDTVKPIYLDLLRSAGIRWLALGIESGSAHVRDGSQKHIEDWDIHEVVKAIQAAGINVIGNYIFGLPDDTMESMRETLELAKLLNCEFANFYSAMAYPGSQLYANAKPEDLPVAWSGYSQHSKDCTPLPTETLTSQEVLAFRDAAFTEYFTNPAYLEMIRRKFGVGTVVEIQKMAATPLERVPRPHDGKPVEYVTRYEKIPA